jgi:hypothetical protein
MYVRCFDPDGNPRGLETEYGRKLGFGPTIFWAGDRFVTAYVMMYDLGKLTYALLLNEFDESGGKLVDEYPLADAQGVVMAGRLALGNDLQFVGGTDVIYAKAQTSDPWGLTLNPFLFTLSSDVVRPALQISRKGTHIQLTWPFSDAGYKVQETGNLGAPAWNQVPVTPDVQNGQCTLTLPMDMMRFFQLAP